METPSIYLDLSARENLIQQFMTLGIPDNKGIQEILELVGLNSTGKRKVKDFSLGMRQRPGIAIALAGNPDFVVLDEQINGLDPQGIIEIRELILRRNRDKGITVHMSVWVDVHDTKGRFTNEDSTPYQYAGHWSWIYFDKNENYCISCTDSLNEWKWMAMDAGKVSPPTDVQGNTHTSGYQVMLLACAFATAGYLALQKRRSLLKSGRHGKLRAILFSGQSLHSPSKSL